MPPIASHPTLRMGLTTLALVAAAFVGSGVLCGARAKALAAETTRSSAAPASPRRAVGDVALRATRRARFLFAPLDGPVAAPPPRLRLTALHGGGVVDVVPFDAEGRPDPAAFGALAALFRASSGEEIPIDSRLVRLLLRLDAAIEEPLVLVSGHREPGRGTSRKSFHVKGMAADIAATGRPVRKLHRIAKRLGVPGLGLYPHFVHVDARDEPYAWTGGRWPRTR